MGSVANERCCGLWGCTEKSDEQIMLGTPLHTTQRICKLEQTKSGKCRSIHPCFSSLQSIGHVFYQANEIIITIQAFGRHLNSGAATAPQSANSRAEANSQQSHLKNKRSQESRSLSRIRNHGRHRSGPQEGSHRDQQGCHNPAIAATRFPVPAS
jgi:hypothetical protein